MPRIVCLSDTHGMHKQIKVPDGDILIHSGDFTGNGTMLEVLHFNKWLMTLPHRLKIVVAGNHDIYLEETTFPPEFLLNDAIYLQNKSYYSKDFNLNFWGSPMTPRFNDWAFMEDRDRIDKYWEEIPNNIDILVTHGPAYKILDKTSRTYGNHNVGCEALLTHVKRVNPKFHIFGHIHDSYGTEKIGDTTFVNCSIVNDLYDITSEPIVIDI